MPIVLGADLGTSKITAVALDTQTGAILACHAAPNTAETTTAADKQRGNSEWDAREICKIARDCLRAVIVQLGEARPVGLGLTGQQHGMVMVDDRLEPLTPFINWQDRRALPYADRARELAGPHAPKRTGCRLATGYMGVTLFWMKEQCALPNGTACFLVDYFAALLTGTRPVTDPTTGASSGLLDVRTNTWDVEVLQALRLGAAILPEVRQAGALLGHVTSDMAAATGLTAGLPVFVGIGDNQASFLGSAGNPADAVLVNVGTGGQVAAYHDKFSWGPCLETRPFPRGGYLLVSAGMCGGAAYGTLEKFFRQVGKDLFGVEPTEPVFTMLNGLAESAVEMGELRCDPYFSGTRADPSRRGSWAGIGQANFTPGHLTRALLEGMARSFREGYEAIRQQSGEVRARLVGAGNGLRENPLLARLVSRAFDMPMRFPGHREEAAYGAALLASVGAGVFGDLSKAGAIIQFETPQ